MEIANRRRRRRPLLPAAFIGAAFATLSPLQPSANAACVVTAAGAVNCNASTATTDTANLDGASSLSSDRTQRFDNGAAIHGAVQSGVVIGGFGLQLAESAAAPRPITMNNQGEVTTTHAIDALHIDGNGGAIHYSGNGGVDNRTGTGAGLFVDNVDGDVSIATGASAIIHGAAGIFASTTGDGALTIATGSGLVSGTTDRGISGATENGALSVTVGSGGVTNQGVDTPAIDLTSINGDISVTTRGEVAGHGAVAGSSDVANIVGGVHATSNGTGDIAVGGSGTYFGQYGRGIWAEQSVTGLGGIVISGSGTTISGTAALGCCSAIRAEIDNPLDSSNIVIDRSGDMIATTTISTPADPLASSDIHAFTFGTGNVIVSTGAGATISNNGLFAIDAETSGSTSAGSIDVSTGAGGALNAGGAGIFAVNSAFAIPALARSKIAVTNNGAINSGPLKNPVGGFVNEGSGAAAAPAGIIAGYDGGPVIGPASGPYTSCGPIGCTTLTPNPTVTGTVSVVNNGAINAAGNGVFAFNFGNGDVSVTSSGPITVRGAKSWDGIRVFSAEVGDIDVATTADVSGGYGSGIHTNSVGRGTTMIEVIADIVKGRASGVIAHSTHGAITIANSGTIQNRSGQPGDLAIKTTGSAALLTNSAGGVVTGVASMTGGGANAFVNAGVWDTLGASVFAGSGGLDNSGVVNVFGATTLRGRPAVTNSGVINLAGLDTSLTTRNYVGAGGILAINADLASDNEAAGKLVIDGSGASGRTVVIVNAIGAGAPTLANGVLVVEAINGATTAPGAFALGSRVAAGAYEYQLYDGGNAATGGDPDDQNWYLRSSGFRPEVPLDAAIPALAARFGLDMLGTYHDRAGEDGVLDATAAEGPIDGQASRLAGWGRLFGETGSGGLVGGGPGSGFGLSGFQTGVDLYRRANADGSQDAAGLYVGAGAATASVNQATGSAAGDLSMSGYTIGAYWTHHGASGWYVDALAQATRYDDIAANSVAGQAFTSNGWGLAASLEGGYPIALGDGLILEPQAQAIVERVSLHGGEDAYGLIDFGDADPLYGRIGARLSRVWTLGNDGAIETWGRANLWRAFGSDASTSFATLSGADPVSLATSLGGTWAQFGLGASSRIVRNVAVFASADYDRAVDGARGHSYEGRIGVNIAW